MLKKIFLQQKLSHWFFLLIISPVVSADPYSSTGAQHHFQQLQKKKTRELRVKCFKHPVSTEVISNKTYINKTISTNPCAKQTRIRHVRVINTGRQENSEQASLINVECALDNASVGIDNSVVYNEGLIRSHHSASLVNIRKCRYLKINNLHLRNDGRVETHYWGR